MGQSRPRCFLHLLLIDPQFIIQFLNLLVDWEHEVRCICQFNSMVLLSSVRAPMDFVASSNVGAGAFGFDLPKIRCILVCTNQTYYNTTSSTLSISLSLCVLFPSLSFLLMHFFVCPFFFSVCHTQPHRQQAHACMILPNWHNHCMMDQGVSLQRKIKDKENLPKLSTAIIISRFKEVTKLDQNANVTVSFVPSDRFWLSQPSTILIVQVLHLQQGKVI